MIQEAEKSPKNLLENLKSLNAKENNDVPETKVSSVQKQLANQIANVEEPLSAPAPKHTTSSISSIKATEEKFKVLKSSSQNRILDPIFQKLRSGIKNPNS